MKRLVLSLLLLAGLIGNEVYGQTGSWISGMPQKTYRWFGHNNETDLQQNATPVSQHPPIFGKKRRNNGMILPLPFGGSIGFSTFSQPYTTNEFSMQSSKNDIRLRFDTLTSGTESGEYKLVFRPDLWLFPFLNIYGVVGYGNGRTTPDVTTPYIVIEDVLLLGDVIVDTTVNIRDEVNYQGPVYGFGITGSTGYKGFFILLNYEYTVTGNDEPALKRTYQHFQAKAGILLGQNRRKAKGSFWLGTMFMHDNHHINGEISTEEVFPGLETILGETLTYEANNTVKNPWNFVFGGGININDHHVVMAEAGFFTRKQISVSYTYRF